VALIFKLHFCFFVSLFFCFFYLGVEGWGKRKEGGGNFKNGSIYAMSGYTGCIIVIWPFGTGGFQKSQSHGVG